MIYRKRGNTRGEVQSGPLGSLQVISTLEAEYTDDEVEFLGAVDRLKKRYPHPTWNQVFHVLLGLGYEKRVRA